VIAFLVLMCYGGGFGTMPAFAADYFGSKNVGPIYGLMLTAWGFASAFGPLLIAYMRQAEAELPRGATRHRRHSGCFHVASHRGTSAYADHGR
jgi:OFA family oxalate/formate antiporter-like MFS transporter